MYVSPGPSRVHDTTLRGGLRVAIAYVVYPPEEDLGIYHPYPEIAEIRVYDRLGRARRADWLTRTITPSEWDALTESLPCA